MSHKNLTTGKVKCSGLDAPEKCGIDDLRAKVEKLTEAIESLNKGANLEYYAQVARQLVSVPETLEKIAKMLESHDRMLVAVLSDRTESHEKVRLLEQSVERLDARMTLLETKRSAGAKATRQAGT